MRPLIARLPPLAPLSAWISTLHSLSLAAYLLKYSHSPKAAALSPTLYTCFALLLCFILLPSFPPWCSLDPHALPAGALCCAPLPSFLPCSCSDVQIPEPRLTVKGLPEVLSLPAPGRRSSAGAVTNLQVRGMASRVVIPVGGLRFIIRTCIDSHHTVITAITTQSRQLSLHSHDRCHCTVITAAIAAVALRILEEKCQPKQVQ